MHLPRLHLPIRPPLAVRRIYGVDRPAAFELCREHPVDTAFIQQNLEHAGIGPSGAVGLFSKVDEARLVALAWISGTVTPFGFSDEGLDLLAEYLRARPHCASSLVGPRAQVLGLWERIQGSWGAAREVRDPQLSMVCDSDVSIEGDAEVRPAVLDEASLVLPAAVAMFTEELGYDPTVAGSGYALRSRSLVRAGRTYIKLGPRVDGPGRRVVFKADVGALSADVAQIQGVWTAPDLRGRGIATAALAEVVRQVRRDHAPVVSLYVNHYNHAAFRVYEKVGFRTRSEWASVLL